ncbi:MAG TPA: amidohydrolase family protein [Bryobacteraceae bacterium]|nr:amidohydrolase family protein [Bryobacteraceae bacterium]
MRIIDFHNHYYPPAYLDALRSGSSAVEVTIDDDGNPRIYYPGDYNICVPGHRDIEYREQVLKELGVDTQVLTLTTPGTHVEKPATAVKFAALVNDAFAEVARRKPGRFTALATLPLNDPSASVKELERACRVLGFRGAMLFSNVNGIGLNDQQFWPLYEAANDLGAVLYIHPTHPVGVEAMTDFWLMPLVGFLMDTTLAAAKIVFSGIPERFPKIRWALCHLGGAIPYLAERLDRGFEAFSECRANIPRPPSDYLRQFYHDTVNFNAGALKLAIAFAGVDHIMAGSDYPHQIGSIPKMIESIRGLDISEAARAAIFGGNAARLLGM